MAGHKNRINVVLVGAGGMGRRWAGVVANHSAARLGAVIDIDLKKAEDLAKNFGAKSYSSLEDLKNMPDIDAAVIALPNKFLAEASKFALLSGKHVLVEKPGATSVRELQEVLDLALSRDLRIAVSYNHRFHPGPREARKLLDSGFLGELMFIRALYGFGGRPGYEKEWRHSREISGGGELIDQGVHLIDLARWFLGDVADAKGFIESAFWKSEVEDNAFLLLKNKEGKIASLHASWSQWKPTHTLEIYGTEGYAIVEGLGKKYGGQERVFYAKRKADFSLPEENVIECDNDADKSLSRVLDEFISSIQEKREPSPGSKDALEVLKIVEKVYNDVGSR